MAPQKRTMVPRLKALARLIEDTFPDLVTELKRVSFSTDRHYFLAGTHTQLRSPGRGREGNKLIVRRRDTGRVVYTHNAAETYRCNQEVVDWIAAEQRRRASPESTAADQEVARGL